MTDDRRAAPRFQQELFIELHAKDERVRLVVFDVSRHGMFVECRDPPPVNQALLLTVCLRGGPFETMATVMRRVTELPHVAPHRMNPHGMNRGGATPLGMGVKIFCLGAEAKARWDRYVAQLESPGLQLPTLPTLPALPTRGAPAAHACFLVQPEKVSELLDFYMHNVVSARTLFVSPAVRMIGAIVQFVLVHPDTREELTLDAKVVEWNPDHPLRMGVRFEKTDKEARARFRAFLGPTPGAAALTDTSSDSLVGGERPKWTEYAFFSPKVRGDAASDLVPEELDVIEGQMLELPAMSMVDRHELFDFDWNAGGDLAPPEDENEQSTDPIDPTNPTAKPKS